MDFVSTAKFSFVVNGGVVGEVVPHRGLRQGCPISPYLFLLCVECLSTLIRESEMDDSMTGIAVA